MTQQLTNITFREPTVEDAQQMVDFYNYVGGETTFLSFEKDEYPMDAKGQEEAIIHAKEQPHCTILMALDGDEIIGLGTISSGNKIKSRHCGELGIVVKQAYQGRGIGSEIIRRLIEFCKSNGVTTKIQLDTRCDNELAVELYKKFGFEEEGRLKNTTLLNGTYYDLYVMGLML